MRDVLLIRTRIINSVTSKFQRNQKSFCHPLAQPMLLEVFVHVYISQLRRKVERDPKNPVYIQTEYGVGYRFEKTVNTPQMETAVKTP